MSLPSSTPPLCRSMPGATLHQALHGGEDYELLFTARPNAALPRRIAGVAVTRIGTITKKRSEQPPVVLIGAIRPSPALASRRLAAFFLRAIRAGTSLLNH